MAQRLVLHIGSMKSGTSFIQNVLGANKPTLETQGVLFAGERWRAQVNAVHDLIGHGGPRQPPLAPTGDWRRLADEINAWSGTAVISMEFLGPRNKQKIGVILDSFPHTDVQVVLSARDLTRNVPAMWLESVQNGSVVTWQDYLDGVRARRPSTQAAKNFWKHQGIPGMAARWLDVVGTERFTLLTVPPKGAPPDLLWRRFAGLLDVDPATVDLEVRANPAIGLASALVLRRLNEILVVDGQVPRHYDRYVKHLLAKRGLVLRQAEEPRLGLADPWALERGREQVAALRTLAPRVLGDLAELEPIPVPGVHARDVPESDQIAAAVAGLARMVELGVERDHDARERVRRARRAARRSRKDGAA